MPCLPLFPGDSIIPWSPLLPIRRLCPLRPRDPLSPFGPGGPGGLGGQVSPTELQSWGFIADNSLFIFRIVHLSTLFLVPVVFFSASATRFSVPMELEIFRFYEEHRMFPTVNPKKFHLKEFHFYLRIGTLICSYTDLSAWKWRKANCKSIPSQTDEITGSIDWEQHVPIILAGTNYHKIPKVPVSNPEDSKHCGNNLFKA